MSKSSESVMHTDHPAERLEELWRQGQAPDLRTFLSSAGDLSAEEMLEVCRVDQRARWKRNERISAETYLNLSTSLSGDTERALELIYAEFLLRETLGEKPSLDEYQQRFPSFYERLADQLAFRRALDARSAVQPDTGLDFVASTKVPLIDTSRQLTGAVPTQRRRGDYELLSELGRGGMGVVYRGRDADLGRDMAIKILRTEHEDDASARWRFVEEAQIAGQLEHPGIAPVHEIGQLPDGRPYFTMKLIHGRTLADLLAERADLSQDRPRFLKIFEQVCQTVAFAHSRHVIHRDLKPSNVMVGEFGEVQVMDWGLAKVIDWARAKRQTPVEPRAVHTLRTAMPEAESQAGAVFGTLAYMAPEQARGEVDRVDERCDVFGLGAILCEILTGQPPFSKGLMEAQEGKGAVDAAARLERCGAESEMVTLAKRCLATNPDNRPRDAGVVAADLRDYLDSVEARLRQAELARAEAQTRAVEARKRQRVLLAGGALLTIVLLAGIVGTSLGLLRANASAEAEKTAKETAEVKQAETRSVLEFVMSRVFAAARRPEERGLGREVTLRKAVESALPFVDEAFPEQPLVEAALRMTLGKSFYYLEEAETSRQQFQRARDLYTATLGPDHPDTLRSMNNLAASYAALNRRAEALNLCEETLALQREKLGTDHPDTLKSMNDLANCFSALRRYGDALKLREETLALQKQKLGPDHRETLRSASNVAYTYTHLGRLADALKLHQEVLNLRKEKLSPDHSDTLQSMHNVAGSHTDLGQHAEALELHEEMLALQKRKAVPDELDILRSMYHVGTSYALVGRHADAMKLLEETLTQQKVKLRPDHPETFRSMNNLANVYAALGRHTDALNLREETLVLRKNSLGPDHRETLQSMHSLAKCYADLGRHVEALDLFEKTLELQTAKFGADHPDTLSLMSGRAETLVKLDRGAEAVPIIDECVRRATGKVVDPRLIPRLGELRLRHFERANDAAGCRATAEMWEKLNRADAASLYQSARMWAITVAVLRANHTSADTSMQGNDEADRAIDQLRKAITAGYKDIADLRQNQDLSALRHRQDFQALLAALVIQTPGKP